VVERFALIMLVGATASVAFVTTMEGVLEVHQRPHAEAAARSHNAERIRRRQLLRANGLRIDAATMLVAADLYPCNRHTLDRRHLTSGANRRIRRYPPLRSILAQQISHIRAETDNAAKTIDESGEKPIGLDRRRVVEWHEVHDTVGHTLHAAAANVQSISRLVLRNRVKCV
jgi:hypothetical protein